MGRKAKILVVDDHPSNVKALRVRLSTEGHEVIEAASGQEALDRFESERPDLVLLDVMMPGMDGYQTCRRIKERQAAGFTPVIMVTAKADTDSMVKGFEAGADDYVAKPFEPVELMARVRAMLRIREMYLENRALRGELRQTFRFDNIIGQSAAMKKVFDLAERVLNHDVTVLLTGETGTGKEAIARAIHYSGPRNEGRFVAANCGALAEGLLESELFGHRRGSFTGAMEDKAGLFEAAEGGTVFLDEISETSPGMQVKLLRVLQEGEVTRVGETKPRKIDVRVIAATNKDLEAEMKAGKFRQDLYYRLSVFPIRLPSLRARIGDIPLLASHFLEKRRAAMKVPCEGFTAEALEAFGHYDWPGNVRELENEIQRALVLVRPGGRIGIEDLSPRIRECHDILRTSSRRGTLKEAVAAVERENIRRAFQKHRGNKTQMAAELGLSRWTLLKKMKALGLDV
jgi:two-component system response regulator AtoC